MKCDRRAFSQNSQREAAREKMGVVRETAGETRKEGEQKQTQKLSQASEPKEKEKTTER